ncbi:MAG: glucose-6-phosphate dehydrogenase, partial [Bacteroidota bacterium]
MGKKQQDTEKFSKFNVIVFGGDGDLAFRKIYPAIFHRMLDGQIEDQFNVVGIIRKEVDRTTLDAKVRQFLLTTDDQPATDAQWEAFNSKIAWIKAEKPDVESYAELATFLTSHNEYDHIFYFSTPSAAFGPISQTLKACGLINERSKVVLEKPLGNSLESSKQINEEITRAFDEHQVYRIDHYLGKETVQNLMVLRFANNLFQRTWDSISIDNIQITVSESLGVEQRADYYDKSGALLDMVQNHLLQLLCLVAMEPPHIIEADEVRNEKLKVLKALRP